MTIRQASKALGLKTRTIREWIKTGRLKAEKTGKMWNITEDIMTEEVQERANKGREHSRRIKAGIELGMLARRSQNPEKSHDGAEREK